jgi:hypothetical protein
MNNIYVKGAKYVAGPFAFCIFFFFAFSVLFKAIFILLCIVERE